MFYIVGVWVGTESPLIPRMPSHTDPLQLATMPLHYYSQHGVCQLFSQGLNLSEHSEHTPGPAESFTDTFHHTDPLLYTLSGLGNSCQRMKCNSCSVYQNFMTQVNVV